MELFGYLLEELAVDVNRGLVVAGKRYGLLPAALRPPEAGYRSIMNSMTGVASLPSPQVKSKFELSRCREFRLSNT